MKTVTTVLTAFGIEATLLVTPNQLRAVGWVEAEDGA